MENIENSAACPLCGRTGIEWEIDHKQPLSRQGTNYPENIWAICRECNRKKGKMTLFEYITSLKDEERENENRR